MGRDGGEPPVGAREGYVDVLDDRHIAGWAHDPAAPGRPLSVDIVVNGEWVARVHACLLRDDLRRLGYGDGRKGFAFAPAPYLRPGENRVRAAYADTGDTLPNGERTVLHVVGVHTGAHAEADLLELSQVRWKGDEHERTLTWGSMMTGDAFVDAVQRHHRFTGAETVLEIGPGYGRILRTLLERGVPFARYTGLELSPARVARLARTFAGPRVCFVTGDILRDPVPVHPDVVLCSSTFEHLFPSITPALHNLQAAATPRTTLFIDFIASAGDDDLQAARAYFEPTTAYIRIYARAELERRFADAGFRVTAIERVVLGQDASGKDVVRALVVAGRGG